MQRNSPAAMARVVNWFKSTFWPTVSKSYLYWQRSDGGLMSAGIAYYAALSLFPLLLLLVAGLGLAFQYADIGEDARSRVLNAVAINGSPQLKEAVGTVLDEVQSNARANGPLAILGLVVLALAGFVQLDRAFDRLWETNERQRSFLRGLVRLLTSRLKSLALVLILVAVILAGHVGGIVLSTFRHFADAHLVTGAPKWHLLEGLAHVALNTFMVSLMYKLFAKRPVRWLGECLPGGLLAAVFWELGRRVLAAIVLHRDYTAYGVIGSFLAVLLWFYYASLILFLCGSFVRVLYERRAASEASSPLEVSG